MHGIGACVKFTASVVLASATGLVTLACHRAEEYAMGRPIEMGPYTFSVTGATRGKSWESVEGRYHEIIVSFRLDRDDSAPFTTDFSSSFLDKMEIVDAAGNRIQTHPVAVDPIYRAGRYRSTQYSSLFRFSRSSEGIRDFAAVGTTPEDFRLLIDNPAPTRGQPRRVTVQLRSISLSRPGSRYDVASGAIDGSAVAVSWRLRLRT